MKILSIETTSDAASIAFLDNMHVLSEYFFQSSDIAGELSDKTELLIKGSGSNLDDVNYIVVSRGPGSWTGIRLGMGFAKGLAAGAGGRPQIYCVGVPDSLFFSLKDIGMPAMCIVNAYRNSVYVSRFSGRFNYSRSCSVKTVDCKTLSRNLNGSDMLLTGPGVAILPSGLKKRKHVKVLNTRITYPQAGFNALLALEKIKRNIPSLPLVPYYGR